MKLFKECIRSGKRGSAISDPGLIRIRTRTIGFLSGIVIALFLLACAPERDERSDSPDTLKTQQPTVQPPADTTAKIKKTTVRPPTKVTVKVYSETTAKVGVLSLAELVRIAEKLGIKPAVVSN